MCPVCQHLVYLHKKRTEGSSSALLTLAHSPSSIHSKTVSIVISAGHIFKYEFHLPSGSEQSIFNAYRTIIVNSA